MALLMATTDPGIPSYELEEHKGNGHGLPLPPWDIRIEPEDRR